MEFQNYVYTVINKNTGCELGCYPNFKKAYERIEELANGRTIIDCGEISSDPSFDVIEIEKHKKFTHIFVNKYVIYQSLLTIFEDDKLVSPSMIYKIKEENRKRNRNSQYRLKTEVI